MTKTKKSTWVLLGLGIFIAAAWLMPNRVYYFFVDSWERRTAEWNGLSIKLDVDKYLFPRKGQSELLIGTRNGNDGILQLSSPAISVDGAMARIAADCSRVKCSQPVERNHLVSSKKVTVIEYTYESSDPRDQMQAYWWVEESPASISYRGSKTTYAQFTDLMNSITTQIANAKK